MITETWLHGVIRDLKVVPHGYRIYRKDRDSHGGGIAILYLESLCITRLPDITGVECVLVKIHFDELHLVTAGFNRPPNSDNSFFEAPKEFMCNNRTSNLMLTGD